jgi:hypothetical protein
MKTTVDALKGLYEKMGGKAEDVENIVIIPDMIDKLTSVAKSGGSTITKNGETLVIK